MNFLWTFPNNQLASLYQQHNLSYKIQRLFKTAVKKNSSGFINDPYLKISCVNSILVHWIM